MFGFVSIKSFQSGLGSYQGDTPTHLALCIQIELCLKLIHHFVGQENLWRPVLRFGQLGSFPLLRIQFIQDRA